MTVGELQNLLTSFDEDMPVVIGENKDFGCQYVSRISYNVDELPIASFYGDDFTAVVLFDSTQIGAVQENNEWEN